VSEVKAGYWGILPAAVRYHKELSFAAKVMFTEFTALCEREGYCWASNAYFAELYGKDANTISEWVNSLRRAGFIEVEIFPEKGNLRRITPLVDKRGRYPEKDGEGYPEKDGADIKENITSVNTKKDREEAKASKAKQFQKPLVEEVAEYAEEIDLDGSEVRAFMDHHEARGWMLGSAKMKDWRAALRTWQRNAKKFAPRIAQRTGPEPITNDGIWQGYLDSLCREWHPGKPDLKYAENALRRARGHVGCDVIAEYLKRCYGVVVSEWQAILEEIK
jgi:hypothetical protein